MNNAYMVEAGSLENDSITKPVVKTMETLYKEAKDFIIAKLRDKYLSLTLEIWVKSNSEIYLLITANFISQSWTSLESFFLGLRPLPEMCLITHPDILSEKVSSQILPLILEEFEIKQENIVHVLFHSVPFNPSSASTQILSKPTWPCFNDTVQRSFDLINEFVTQLTNCDMLHDTLKIGKQVLPQYKEVRKHPGKLMAAMKTFLESQQSTDGLPLKIEEIDECTKLHEPFNVIIEALVDDPLIPASTILPLVFLVKNVYESQVGGGSTSSSTWTVEQRQEIVQSINNQIEAYYKINLNSGDLGGDPLLAVCSFLDPRYKKLKFLTKEQRDHVHDAVLELLHEQGRKEKVPNSGTGSILSVRSENPDYCEMNGGGGAGGDDGTSSDPLNPETPPDQGGFKKGGEKNGKFYDIIGTIIGRRQVQVPSLEAMEELTNYWDEPVPAMTMDPWTWWRYNKERFPKLSELARRYMVIRGTASFTKLDFTAAGKRFWNQLAGIEGEYVEKMQFLRRYYSSSFAELTEEGNGMMGNCMGMDEQMDIKRETGESIELVDEAMD